MPRGMRRNPRLRGLLEKRIEKKTFASIVSILSIVIIVCIVGITIQTYRTREEYAKKEEERIRKLREIFVAEEEEEEEETTSASNNVEEKTKQDTYVTIAVAGDILCEKPLYDDAYDKESGTFNFLPMFQNIQKYTKYTDLTLGTMETNFTDDAISGYRLYNSPKELGNALQTAGVDVLSTAHNHSLDYGLEGIQATKEYFDSLQIDTVGTKLNPEEDSIVIKEVNEIKIAILSYTYGINEQGTKTEEELSHVNLIDKEKIKQDIEKAKEQGAEYICTMLHWGDLTSSKVNQEQQELADFLVENGVDLILGSHPAVIQPLEIRQNAEGENVFISYSVGNYISASEYENSNIEMILEVKIKKDAETGKVSLNKVTYTPVYLLDNGKNAENRYELYDIKDVIQKYENGEDDVVTKELYEKLKQALKEIEKLVGKEEEE